MRSYFLVHPKSMYLIVIEWYCPELNSVSQAIIKGLGHAGSLSNELKRLIVKW